MTKGETDMPLSEDAIVVIATVLGQFLREIPQLQRGLEPDSGYAIDRLRYLVETACQPWQIRPLSPEDAEIVKGLFRLAEIVYERPDDPVVSLS